MEGVSRRTSLIADLLIQYLKSRVSSGLASHLARPTVVIDDEEEDESIPSLLLRKKA